MSAMRHLTSVGFVVMGLGLVPLGWQVRETSMQAAEARAARAARPGPVAETISARLARGTPAEGEEVHLVGQIDPAMRFLLTSTESGLSTRQVFMIPVLAPDAAGADAPVLALLLDPAKHFTGKSLPRQGDGPIGPVVAIRGRAVDPASFMPAAVGALAEAGRNLGPAAPLAIDPFLPDRETELTRTPTIEQVWIGIWLMSAFMVLFGVIRLFTRGRPAAERRFRRSDAAMLQATLDDPLGQNVMSNFRARPGEARDKDKLRDLLKDRMKR